MPTFAAVLGGVLLARCSDAPSGIDAAVSPSPEAGVYVDAGLDLGTGQLFFTALPPDGATTELIHGPQGGFHIFARLRFERLAQV